MDSALTRQRSEGFLRVEQSRTAANDDAASHRGKKMTAMQCLVIMPFSGTFDAVFRMVQSTVVSAVPGEPIDCYWLKDIYAAGRITDDILGGIQKAALCFFRGNMNNVLIGFV